MATNHGFGPFRLDAKADILFRGTEPATSGATRGRAGMPVSKDALIEAAWPRLRCAGDHVVYLWTFTGTHSGTKRPLRVSGWEEWDLDADYKVKASRGWYDADDYTRQIGG